MHIILRFIFNVCLDSRPEKSKLQTIPGQLNVTIECVPPDFSSMYFCCQHTATRLFGISSISLFYAVSWEGYADKDTPSD